MKCMKILMHQQPYKEIVRSFGLEKLFSLRWSSSSWFFLGLICLWIATLEVVLLNHTMIISYKPCFVIIKIKINKTLVSHTHTHIYIYIERERERERERELVLEYLSRFVMGLEIANNCKSFKKENIFLYLNWSKLLV